MSEPERTPGKSRDPKRSILPMNELLLTLVRLRLGFLNADLAYRFHISAEHVSIIVLTWIQFLYKRFSDLKRLMYAKRSMINKKHLLKCFKKYKIFVALMTTRKFMRNNQATLLHKEMLTHLTKGILHLSS